MSLQLITSFYQSIVIIVSVDCVVTSVKSVFVIYLQKSFCFFSVRVTSIDFVNLFISFFLFVHCMNISSWFINNKLYLFFCVLRSFSQFVQSDLYQNFRLLESFSQFVQVDFYQQFRVISFHFENTRISSFFSNQTSWNRKI